MVTDTSWDFVAVGLQLLTTIIIVVVLTYVWLIVDRLHSIESRDVASIVCAMASGLVWMWSAFVSDMHLSLLLPLNRWGCTLWDFWLQYALGLNLMLTFIIVRLNWYRLLSKGCTNTSLRNSTVAVIAACMLPVIVVCCGVEYNDASSVDKRLGVCITQLAWKYGLIGSLAFNYVIMLLLLLHKLRRSTMFKADKELAIGAAVAACALIGILILNLTHQTLLVYGRVLKSVCIDISCLSLLAGLIGMPVLRTLEQENDYERMGGRSKHKLKKLSDVNCVTDLLYHAYSNDLYTHYLYWVRAHYEKCEPWSIGCEALCKPILLDPNAGLDSRYNKVFQGYTTYHQERDPVVFVLPAKQVVNLLLRMELMLKSEREVDDDWRNSILNEFLTTDIEANRVNLPYNLLRQLIDVDSTLNYKNLLLCAKLWLLAQMEQLTWLDYISDERGLHSFQPNSTQSCV